MPRTRWAVQCRARSKSAGRRCTQFAIRGGTVCWHHGGAANTSKWAASSRLFEEDLLRAGLAEKTGCDDRTVLWLARRAVVAAEADGMMPAHLLAASPVALARVEAEHGITPPPRPQLHRDRRFRARRPDAAEPGPPPANSRMPARDWHRPGCVNWPQPGRSLCGTSAELAPLFDAVRRLS
jgi:hypothetical protein